MATTASPLSSPRLPSPPPIAEIQLGPKSPSPGTEEQQKLFSTLDSGASRRIRPGTRAADMAEGPPLVDLSEIDSAFQLTEHLKALHNFLTHPPDTDTTAAVDRDMALKLAHPPENVDKTLWLYELCRFLTQKVNAIIIALFSDSPPCSSSTCPEMRASEWQYLCAVHDPPKSCGAIDYSCHTLDWAANTLTSPKNFPSRLAMGPDQSTQHQQIRNLTNIFRRVYRIFAHAWFQHRDMFWKVEGRTGLYVFFKTVCDVYDLIPEDNYTIPPEAEGIEQSEEAKPARTPLILKREPSGPGAAADKSSLLDSGDNNLSTPGTSTTKRHRNSPTVSLSSVATVVEESEEDEAATETTTAKQEAPSEPAPTSSTPASETQPAAAEQANDVADDNETVILTPDDSTDDAASESEATSQQSASAPPSEAEDAQRQQHEDGSVPNATDEATQEAAAPAPKDDAAAAPAPEQQQQQEKTPAEDEERKSDDGDGANPASVEEKAGKQEDEATTTAAADPDKDQSASE